MLTFLMVVLLVLIAVWTAPLWVPLLALGGVLAFLVVMVLLFLRATGHG